MSKDTKFSENRPTPTGVARGGSTRLGSTRRGFIRQGAALSGAAMSGLAAPALFAQSRIIGEVVDEQPTIQEQNATKYNNSTFRTQLWSDHFKDTSGGAILVDINSYSLHYWDSSKGIYRLYPVAIPLKEEFTKRGYTKVIRKVAGPEWRPTKDMLKRDPSLPEYVGPGPENPLGTHALYLDWQYYRIHGNNDQRKIGRRASNGCIGLYNAHIEDLFGMVRIGCKVRMI